MQVLTTEHTSFTVADLDGTVAYFQEVFGFEVAWPADPPPDFMPAITGVPEAKVRVCVVRTPGHAIELFQYYGPSEREHVRSRACDVGFAHLAFRVDDVEGFIQKSRPYGFVPAGLTVTYRTDRSSVHCVYLRGPDGLTIEFIQPL